MVVKYPTIPENLENHFIRGVFDGDGCISLRTDKRDNQKRGQL
jgi:intein-encoded DNA endonuclease-like protein